MAKAKQNTEGRINVRCPMSMEQEVLRLAEAEGLSFAVAARIIIERGLKETKKIGGRLVAA